MASTEQKSRLIWQCRRGMLELDLVFKQFLSKQLDGLSTQQITALEHLLTYSDPVIYDWLIGDEIPYEQELIDIVAFIRRQHQLH